ncbi:unnamed protein product, partial [Hymenolepis diminuta]
STNHLLPCLSSPSCPRTLYSHLRRHPLGNKHQENHHRVLQSFPPSPANCVSNSVELRPTWFLPIPPMTNTLEFAMLTTAPSFLSPIMGGRGDHLERGSNSLSLFLLNTTQWYDE